MLIKRKYKKLISEINLLKDIPHVSTLIHINQYNPNKQDLVEKSWFWQKISGISVLVTNTARNTKIREN